MGENKEKIGKGHPPKHGQFKKGVVTNPNGRPKGARSRSTIVKHWLEAMHKRASSLTGQVEELEIQDHIVLSLINKALDGDVAAFKELMDSGHGKIPDKTINKNEHEFKSGLDPKEAKKIIDELKNQIDL
jgi:hypothetical protein